MTYRDLIELAYLNLNVFSSGDDIDEHAESVAFNVLNRIFDDLGAVRGSMFTINRLVFNLLGGKQTYLIGPGNVLPDWNSPRPTEIYRAGIVLDAYSNPPLEKPLHIITDAMYAATRIKQLPSTFPTEVYNDGNFPSSTIWYYPAPTIAFPVTLYVPLALAQVSFANITSELSYPPGYTGYLEDILTYRLAPKWSVDPTAYKPIAEESMLKILNANTQDLILRCDPAMRGPAVAGYNIYTGGFGRRGR